MHIDKILITNIDKIVLSNKISFGKKGFKYFDGYKDTKKIKPWCTYFPKRCGFWKYFDQT